MSSSSPQMEHSVAEPEDDSTFLLIVRNLESAPLFGMYGCDQRGSRGTKNIRGSRGGSSGEMDNKSRIQGTPASWHACCGLSKYFVSSRSRFQWKWRSRVADVDEGTERRSAISVTSLSWNVCNNQRQS